MTKNQLKRIAKIYAANCLFNIDSYSELLTAEENKQLNDELKIIADKMTIEPLNFGELDQIIKYVTK